MALLWRYGAPALMLLAACSGENDPLTPTTGIPPLTNPSNVSNDDDPSAVDPTSGGEDTGSDSGEPTTGPDPTDADTGSTGGGPPPPSMETCERYLDCLAVIRPEDIPEAQQGFGPDGTCWDGPVESQEQCILACQTALEELHMFYPEEAACWLCQQAEDCGPDMTCEAGDCMEIPGPGCGDGIVQDDETCDTPYCYEFCQEADCNPLSNAGCTGGEECRFAWYETMTGVQCLEDDGTLPTDGQGCQYEPQVGIDYCDFGLVCAPAELINGCQGTGCCTRLCDLQGPDDCPNGRVCEAFPEELYYYSSYVGVCVLH